MHSPKDKTAAASVGLTEVQSSTPGQKKLRKSVTLLKQQLGHTDRVLLSWKQMPKNSYPGSYQELLQELNCHVDRTMGRFSFCEIFKFLKYFLHLSPEVDLDELLHQNIWKSRFHQVKQKNYSKKRKTLLEIVTAAKQELLAWLSISGSPETLLELFFLI